MTPRKIHLEVLEDAARVLRAVAHPLRLRLLEILGHAGEKNVTSLCEASGAPQPAVSQQLARLRHEGVLAARRDGSQVFYRVARPEVLGLLECVRRTARGGRSS
ncbi:MAG: metalloregulator ArsR/SmtB family transcription factor [Planctomycetes bacterium]|nr:metalloregulator ArsR/SmtB family transcription factor [Planctomycetota bacterium]